MKSGCLGKTKSQMIGDQITETLNLYNRHSFEHANFALNRLFISIRSFEVTDASQCCTFLTLRSFSRFIKGFLQILEEISRYRGKNPRNSLFPEISLNVYRFHLKFEIFEEIQEYWSSSTCSAAHVPNDFSYKYFVLKSSVFIHPLICDIGS